MSPAPKKRRRDVKPDNAAPPPTLEEAALELYSAAKEASGLEGGKLVALEDICAAHRRWVTAQQRFDLACERRLVWNANHAELDEATDEERRRRRAEASR